MCYALYNVIYLKYQTTDKISKTQFDVTALFMKIIYNKKKSKGSGYGVCFQFLFVTPDPDNSTDDSLSRLQLPQR